MTTDHMELRAAANSPRNRVDGCVDVPKVALQELLAAYDALAHPAAPVGKYSAEFEEAWSEYPKRPGASKAATWKAWQARIKAKVSPEVMVEGARRYAAYCKAERTEPQFIKQPATFFGPGEHYEADWASTRTAAAPRRQMADRREQKKADSNAEALRILDGIPAFGGEVIDMEDCYGPR